MKLKGRSVDAWGNVVFDQTGLIDLLMKGSDFGVDIVSEPSISIQRFNDLCREFDHPEDSIKIYHEPDKTIEEWDEYHQSHWFTPEPFTSLDVHEWLLEKCSNEEQRARVLLEWKLFEERHMEPVLRCLIYLVHHFRERGIVWGVGRGSSVASYCLFLIGIHKVDSLKFDLDPREFLK